MKLLIALLAWPLLAIDPSIVFIGDPHLNLQTAAATWTAQTNWIAANASAWNVQAVLCAGDFDGGVVNGGKDETANVTAGWANGWNTIDAMGLPYLSAVGNHDYDDNRPSTRNSLVFDAQIGYQRIKNKTWFAGSWDDGANSRANEAIYVTVGSRKLLIIALEFYCRPAAIAWASSLVEANLDREVIIITHGHMNTVSGDVSAWGDTWGPVTYSLPADSTSGVLLVEWAKRYPNNVHLILCGHNDPWALRNSARVYSIMSDYQDSAQLCQVILIISFAANSITINNYNTTTQTLDTTVLPPLTLTWPLPSTNKTYVLRGE